MLLNRKFLIRTILILIVLSIYPSFSQNVSRAGLRSSVYGINPFPDSEWWFNTTTDMSNRFDNSEAAVIWILGYTTNNGCFLNFPKPNDGKTYSKIYFGSSDKHEEYLSAFDKSGVKVWLQVEPGQADILTLIDLALTQYGHHPCVIGFGVDVEWYKTSTHHEGKAVTDEEAQSWSEKIKSYNSDYLLFTKHWLIDKMPPTFRDDIVFVDDSQIFPDMESMVSEFEDWANAFAPAKVAYQYGYTSDKIWWQHLSDPPKEIGDEIVKRCPNTSDLYWVDFTAYDLWDQDFKLTSVERQDKDQKIERHSNYPNPFNAGTTISYSINERSFIDLEIVDVQGQVVKKIYKGTKEAGDYQLNVDCNDLGSGIYFNRLRVNENISTKKMVLMK